MNLVSIRVLRAIGVDYAIDYLARFGFHTKRMPRDLTLALGSSTVTPLELTTGFAVFANGGSRVAPYYLTRIEDSDHKMLEQANPPRACEAVICDDVPATTPASGPGAARPDNSGAARMAPRVITAENAFLTTSMLRDVISAGTGQGAMVLGRQDLAGKTGTTNDQRDAWFAGYNAGLVAVAWVGFDTPAPLGHGEVGGRAALPMWVDFMRAALAGRPEQVRAPPPGIVTTFINRDTGKPTEPNDPRSMVEFFVDGTIPSAESGEVIGDPGDVSGESIREELF
jgi:penicillin-binding protein 1A